MTVKAETGVMQLQAQEHLRVPTKHRELRRGGRGRIPIQLSEGGWPCQHLDLRFQPPETCDVSVVSKPSVCSSLLWQP